MGKAPLLGLAFAVIPLLSAEAAPATPEEAARLTTLLERYVGAPAAGEPASVTVSPSGDSYRVTLDLKRALSGLESFGVTIDPNVSATMLTPLPDGTWKVASTESPPVTVHFRDQTVSIKAASTSFNGLFDPVMSAFKTIDALYTGYDFSQTAPNVVQNSHIGKLALTYSGALAEGGTVTGTAHQLATDTGIDMLVRSPNPPPPSGTGDAAVQPPVKPATPISYTALSSTLDFGMEKLHTKELLDLWAFLVAHPNHDSLVAAQDDLRTVLRAALPVASGLDEHGSVDSFAATTPIGAFSAKTVAGAVELSKLDGVGRMTEALTVTDLMVPADRLPPWARGLVPTGIAINLGADGIHAAEAAAEAVNDFDLRSDKPFTPEQRARIGHLAWPGAATVTLMPSRLTSKLLDLNLDGQATLGEEPDGHLTIRATGLDKAIASLQAAAGTDPSAAQALGPLVLAKNLAKSDADGSLSWLIEMKGKGAVTINGAPLQ